MAEINAMTTEEFLSVVGPVFEQSPWIAARRDSTAITSLDRLHASLPLREEH